MTGRTLLRLIADGRLTFVLAGATLGVGAYGFAVTLRPYESGRVFEPIPSLSEPLARVSVYDPVEPFFPDEIAVAEATPAPRPPGEHLVALPRPQPAPAPAPVQAAGDDEGGVTPLDPPPPTPSPTPTPPSIGPIVIDPVEPILPVYPARSAVQDSEPSPSPSTPGRDEDDGDTDEKPGKDTGKGSNPGGKRKPEVKGNDNPASRGAGRSVESQENGKARGLALGKRDR